jgi:beta-mannosidase
MASHIRVEPVGWQYKQREADERPLSEEMVCPGWSACSQFPTEIHLELMKAKKIPHPYKGRNEHDVQWVSKQHWLFRSEIHVSASDLQSRNHVELEFEGLDTFATVYLNGDQILESDNHFLPHHVSPSHKTPGATWNH